MEYRFLGTTGLKVSVLSLGTMGFGAGDPDGRTAASQSAAEQVGRALDAGVNLFDTADSYGQGRAEELLGSALGRRRDGVLVSSKVHSRSGSGPNDVGLSRWHVARACEDSLRRLGTDHLDIYYLHGFDGCTAVEEVVEGVNDLVRSGKVRYIGCSNLAAWQVMKVIGAGRSTGSTRIAAYQGYYSLVGRDIEHDILPMCRDQGLGVVVWSPLAGGFLTGKFSGVGAHGPAGTRRASIGDVAVGRIDPQIGAAALAVMSEIAVAREVSVSQVALNWLRANDDVSSVTVGARSAEQLASNLGALEWTLDASEVARLTEATATFPPYPHWFQRRFTAERFSRSGAPPGAFDYGSLHRGHSDEPPG